MIFLHDRNKILYSLSIYNRINNIRVFRLLCTSLVQSVHLYLCTECTGLYNGALRYGYC